MSTDQTSQDSTPPTTANATFCATVVDEWIRQGLTAAFIAPGSRSTPLALALVDRTAASGGELAIHVFHDERSAAFAALGHGLETMSPAVVLCSSGTAGTHFHAAVVEAGLSCVPMLVCTADRPPELWGRGAPQVIDQTDLFGGAVRAFAEPGPPDDTDPGTWRSLAAITWGAATDAQPGPVHLNLSFRDPLAGEPGDLPPSDPALEPGPVDDPTISAEDAATLASRFGEASGAIVAGRGQNDGAAVRALGERLGWVVIADHRSGSRGDGAMSSFDALLRHRPFAESVRPDVILRLGEIVSSKAVSQWITACAAAGTEVVASQPWGRFIDPEDVATTLVPDHGLVDALLEATERLDVTKTLDVTATITAPSPAAAEIRDRWLEGEALAVAAIEAELATIDHPTDVAVAKAVLAAPPAGGALVTASSMPIRDLEWYGGNRDDITVYANRGANGIDGTIATAIGVAASGVATVCHIGDVALLHDSTSLVALAARPVDLTIVVTDNDGGAIFSFLPQHTLLDAERYELLFGTPHGTDLASLARAHGIRVEAWPADLTPNGVRLVIATTDRAENLALHNRLVNAVATALS